MFGNLNYFLLTLSKHRIYIYISLFVGMYLFINVCLQPQSLIAYPLDVISTSIYCGRFVFKCTPLVSTNGVTVLMSRTVWCSDDM